ncbi:MAG: GHMP kinase [Planctomycetes bacterium]|nr:GHMP kinase [Planctomycetota bacterium]
MVKSSAYARAGLVGNPSDGYFGKTISVILKNFSARAVIYEWPELEIILSKQDRCLFDRLDDLVEDVKLNGLYGGLRLIKAAIKKFAEYCRDQRIGLAAQNFSLRYETDIPRQVGLAGSSAIITAVFKGLMEFYGVEIPKEVLPTLILSVETEEIGISAGLQDRVCQVYEGLVYMDFERRLMEASGRGRYEVLPPDLLPPLYVAYRTDLSKISGTYHSNLRARWEAGDPEILKVMETFAGLAERGRECFLKKDYRALAELMDLNFDTRARIGKLDPRNVEMVRLARRLGVCANYAGSGGAVVGICEDDALFRKLQEEFARISCIVIRPLPLVESGPPPRVEASLRPESGKA